MMKFTELGLSGVWLIEPEVFSDERGFLFRSFCAQELEAHGIVSKMVQGNVSINPQRGTLRGFHYQVKPHEEAKTFSCITGAIYDIVVDLRKESPTYLKWIPIEISAEKQQSLHVPSGCANAWLSIAPQTTIHYYMSEFYTPNAYKGFNYRDPAFNFKWPMSPSVISEKDRNLPNFNPTLHEKD